MERLLWGPLDIMGCVCFHYFYVVYRVHLLLPEFPSEKVALLTRVLCGRWMVFKFGVTTYQLFFQVVIRTMYGSDGFDEETFALMHKCEGLYEQV